MTCEPSKRAIYLPRKFVCHFLFRCDHVANTIYVCEHVWSCSVFIKV